MLSAIAYGLTYGLVCAFALLAAQPAEPEPSPTLGAAERFVRAIYAGDAAAEEAELAPVRTYYGWFADREREEPSLELEELTVSPYSREEAGDTDPFSPLEYARVDTRFRYGDRYGGAVYVVGLQPGEDGPRVSVVARNLQWAP